MRYHATPSLTTRLPISLHALLTVAVGVLLLILLSQMAPVLADGSPGVVYVANFVSNDVWVYTIQANGDLQLQGSVGAGQGPRSITVSPDGRFAYVTNVNSHEITLYDIDALGNLTKRSTSGNIISPTIFDPARALAIHPTGHRLYLPEYLTAGCLPICAPSNSWLSIYALDAEGFLGAKTTVESGQIPRAVAVTHSGRNVYVATQGASRVCIYKTDETTGDVTEIPGCLPTGGSYPEAVKVDPTDKYAYVVNSGGGNEPGSVTAFSITPAGLLSPITTVPAGLFPLEIAFNPSGTFAAVVDHDGNALFLYRIASTGEPIPQGSVPTGTHPFSVAFDPSGRFAYVANFVDNTLSRFALDAATGQVTLQGTVPTGSGPAAVAVFAPQDTAAPSLLENISTRGVVGAGDEVLIGGFIIEGTAPKTVVIRALGPTLATFGVAGALADPMLELFNRQGTRLEMDDDWRQMSRAAELEATSFPGPPPDTREAAIMTTLAPGEYTAIVRGVGSGTGVGLVEVYDGDNSVATRLVNISTRGRVGTGDDVLIGGIIIEGTTPRTVIIRALGPTLATFGVAGALANPTLELFDQRGTRLDANDDWGTHARVAELQATLFPGPPPDAQEAAIMVTLAPGEYTAIVRGVGGTTGVALVEVYEVE